MRNLLRRRRAAGGYVPPPATFSRFWVGGTGTWDQASTTHWSATSGGASGASVPTQYADVIFDANSGVGTVTISVNAPCNSLETGLAGNVSSIKTLVHNASITLSIGSNSAAGPSNVALNFSGLTTYTKGGGQSSVIAFVSSVPTQQTINYAGLTLASQTFNGAGGSWKLLAALAQPGGGNIIVSLTAGSLDTNGQAVTAGQLTITGASTRSLTLGASLVTLTGAFSGAYDATNTSGLTLSAASSTITLSGVGAAQTFRGGGLSYGTVNITGTGTAGIAGSNTFATLNRSNAVAVGLRFVHGTTQTIATAAGLTISGTAGNLVTVDTDLAGTAATLSIASGTVNANFLSLKDSAASGGATFHAGAGSTNVSGNSGWIFP